MKCIRDLNLLDDFSDETWKVTEWFGDDYGLAGIDGEFWIVAVGSVEEGGNKWWFKMRLKTDDIETARKVILPYKPQPASIIISTETLFKIKNG